MLKSGDVIVCDEKKLEELWAEEVPAGATAPLGDLRQGARLARAMIEESESPRELCIVRIERVARSRPKRPAFDAIFDGEADDKPEGGAA